MIVDKRCHMYQYRIYLTFFPSTRSYTAPKYYRLCYATTKHTCTEKQLSYATWSGAKIKASMIAHLPGCRIHVTHFTKILRYGRMGDIALDEFFRHAAYSTGFHTHDARLHNSRNSLYSQLASPLLAKNLMCTVPAPVHYDTVLSTRKINYL